VISLIPPDKNQAYDMAKSCAVVQCILGKNASPVLEVTEVDPASVWSSVLGELRPVTADKESLSRRLSDHFQYCTSRVRKCV
jgi:hypothetical protein